MSKGSWTATEVDSVILAADATRSEVNLQQHSGDEVYLGFGEAAVVGAGIRFAPGAAMTIQGNRAQLAIHGICASGMTGTGGYQTA